MVPPKCVGMTKVDSNDFDAFRERGGVMDGAAKQERKSEIVLLKLRARPSA
jgi:hypothetical protein